MLCIIRIQFYLSYDSLEVLVFCGLFALSVVFLIVASTQPFSYSLIAYIESCSAVVIVLLSIFIYMRRSSHKFRGLRKLTIQVYRTLITIPILLIFVYFTDCSIRWDVLLIGLGWRFWILSIVLEELAQIFLRSRSQRLHMSQHVQH